MKTKYLNEVAEIRVGNSAPQGEEPFINGKYNFYRTFDVGQIKQGEISESRDKVNKETYSNLKTFQVNTILFPKSGASTFNNNRVMIKEEGAIASHLAGIKAIPEILNDYYLYYFLLTIDAKDLVQDSSYPSVNLKQISQIEIPVPSIQEQQKIVDKLDEFFISIGNYNLVIDENIKLLKRLFISILDNEFGPYKQNGSELKKLSDISQIKGGKRVPKGYKLSDQKTNFPYIRVSDFDGNGGIDQSNIKYIDENIYKQIKKYSINSNDLFISIAGTIGKSGFVPNNLDGANLTENACKLVFNENTHNRYIYFFTKSNYFNKQVLDKTKTSSQPKLALKRLGEILVQVPTLEKQIELTNKLDVIEDKLNDLINKKNRLIIKTDLFIRAVLKKEFSHE